MLKKMKRIEQGETGKYISSKRKKKLVLHIFMFTPVIFQPTSRPMLIKFKDELIGSRCSEVKGHCDLTKRVSPNSFASHDKRDAFSLISSKVCTTYITRVWTDRGRKLQSDGLAEKNPTPHHHPPAGSVRTLPRATGLSGTICSRSLITV